MFPRDEITTYLPEMVALSHMVTSEAYLPHPAISTLLTFSSSPRAFLQSPPSSCDLSQQAIGSSDHHNRFAMPHHDSNFETVLSWGMDLSAVYFLFLMSYRVVGGTYSGPSAAAWEALDPCGDCYVKLLAFLLQNLDTFQTMFFFAFCRFLTLWLLLEVMKAIVRILYAFYCVYRRNRLVGDNKEYTHPL
ncbi:hypothetical protein N7541_011423 [Penicillium brevicompactum]|uniref:Uncharacterized protein n=1 Tax=Penicillium brevicompactum TaxID=5074 RepID=A0A9W9QTF3_PENBR|nr:hypothetical protein N7541_011423 [Penicillium brevicompactum]